MGEIISYFGKGKCDLIVSATRRKRDIKISLRLSAAVWKSLI